VGNVALDVARVLAKTNSEMSITDLVDYAADAAQSSPVTDIHMLGRRGPVEAAFTNVELREMGGLENAAPIMNPDHLPGKIVADYMSDRDLRLREKNLETMRSFLDVSLEDKNKRVHFGFFLSPIEILGQTSVEGVRCERTTVDENGKVHSTGETVDIPAQIVITCIGSRAFPIDDVPFNDDWGVVENEEGKVSDRLYAVGWLKRGASGTIGTNKNDSLEVVDKIIGEYDDGGRSGCDGMDTLLKERNVRVVSFEEWQIIDRLEVEAAPPGAPRRKFITPTEMIAALDAAQVAA
jgi:ferredoxin--NADP+ reductase